MTTLNAVESTGSAHASDDDDVAWEIATLFPRQGQWTEDEYLDLTDDTNHLIELVKNRLEFLPMPTDSHQGAVLFFIDLFRLMVTRGLLGRVRFAPLRVKTHEGFREPDVLALLPVNAAQNVNRTWQSADIVVEVISDGGRKRDTVEKRADYAASGFPEYWIVDPEFHRITVLTLQNGEYATHSEATSGVVSSALLAGLTCDVDACFAAAEK